MRQQRSESGCISAKKCMQTMLQGLKPHHGTITSAALFSISHLIATSVFDLFSVPQPLKTLSGTCSPLVVLWLKPAAMFSSTRAHQWNIKVVQYLHLTCLEGLRCYRLLCLCGSLGISTPAGKCVPVYECRECACVMYVLKRQSIN